MRLYTRFIFACLWGAAAASLVLAGAPHVREYMRPVDTSAGSLSDPNRLLTADLEKPVTLSIHGLPLEVALLQIRGALLLDFGYVDVDKNKPITVDFAGSAKEALRIVGNLAGVRYEAQGPLQIRVMPARSTAPKRPAPPPPVKHN